MLTKSELIEILHKEVTPATGCTEPVCVALAAADSYHVIQGKIVSIKIEVSPSVYKNGMAVNIPGFPKTGLKYAAALGACLDNPEKKLNLFEDIAPEILEKAIELVDEKKVIICINEGSENLFVHSEVITTNGIGITTIRNSHANIVFTKKNDKVIFTNNAEINNGTDLNQRLCEMTVSQIRAAIESMTLDDIDFLLEGVKMNQRVSENGLSGEYGIGIGKMLKNQDQIFGAGLNARVMYKTAACAESRMAGCPYAVMSTAGSGNHGITAIIPISELALEIRSTDEKLAQALAFSHLLTVYIKQFTGKLSATCGCGVGAAVAASAAMTWLLGGNDKEISGAIINMCGNLTGMICDGGKIGCALKLASAASAALMSAYLAISDVIIPASNGIVTGDAESSIRNLGIVSTPGMVETDKTILNIMLNKTVA